MNLFKFLTIGLVFSLSFLASCSSDSDSSSDDKKTNAQKLVGIWTTTSTEGESITEYKSGGTFINTRMDKAGKEVSKATGTYTATESELTATSENNKSIKYSYTISDDEKTLTLTAQNEDKDKIVLKKK